MKSSTRSSVSIENNVLENWFSEMQKILGPIKEKDAAIEERILGHINRCQLVMEDFQTRSMFFLLDNASLKYLFVTKSAPNVLGYSRETIVGKGFKWLFTMFSEAELEYKKQVMSDLYEFLKTLDSDTILNCTVRYDLVLERSDGKPVHLLEEMMYPEVNSDGEPVITSCFLHDIGEYANNDKRHCAVYLNTSGLEEMIYSKSYQVGQKNNCPLSEREIQILEQFSNGLTSAQAAEKLFVSENTIKTHRKNILRKLGVVNTSEAVKLSLKNKWLS